MKTINECISEKGIRKKISCSEKNKTFTLEAKSDFYCELVNIDNCVFANEKIRRCDYLFIVPKEKKINNHLVKRVAYYVELKGDDIRSACEQLYNAIDKTKAYIPNYMIHAKVIATKGFHPNIGNNDYYLKVRRLIKRNIDFHRVHKGNNFNHAEVLL